jgi:hypothetical protein
MQMVADTPADAAFTLTEMAVSLFLAAIIMLGIAEISRSLARTYVEVTGDIRASQDSTRLEGWMEGLARVDPDQFERSSDHFIGSVGQAQQVELIVRSTNGESLLTLALLNNSNPLSRSRGFALDFPARLAVVPLGYLQLENIDYPLGGYAQRLERSVPFDCQFDVVSRGCR